MKLCGLHHSRKPLWASIMGTLLTSAVMVSLLTVLIGSFASFPPASAQVGTGSYWVYNVTYTEDETLISNETMTSTITYYETIGGNYCSHIVVENDRNPVRYMDNGHKAITLSVETWYSNETGLPILYEGESMYEVVAGSGELLHLSFNYSYKYYDLPPVPFDVGDKWRVNVTIRGFYMGVQVDAGWGLLNVTVEATEDVTVPAGTFTCMKMNNTLYENNDGPVTPPRYTIQWWSNETSSNVKEWDNSSYDGLEQMVLTEYGAPAVGGIWTPVDKLALMAPYIALASAIIIAVATTSVFFKHRKKH